MGGRAGGGARGGGGAANLQALYQATGGDARALMEAAGYTGLPKVVNKLDKSKAWEGVELERGMESAEFAQALKTGKMHVGSTTANAYGEGIYSWAGGEAKNKADGYGKAGRVTMTLSKSAKVANYEKLAGELKAQGVKDVSKKISAYAISKGYHAIHVSNGHLHRPDSGKKGLFGGAAADVVVVLDRRKLNILK